MYNIETLYKARNEAIEFYDDYSLIMSEAKIRAIKEKGLKILTPKHASEITNSSCTSKSRK